ncbi:hypothetical protein [Pseudonocardia acaciae]|uniref:hypothetical protein n=1 Tax=Pseudonocardia acaciae TaxID=551276 RepID=UPI00048E7B57|nr:hypothetical protein [Pseudonocardia acaciae]
MTSAVRDGSTPLAPVLRELTRIADAVEAERSARDQALIDALRKEVAELRAAVAHLRASAAPLPAALRPVVARSLVDAGHEASDPGSAA